MTRPPLSPDALTEYLRGKYGLKRGRRRLAELRADGSGPVYYRVGNEILYPVEEADAWAEAQLGPPLRSTSEERARRLLKQATNSTTANANE